MDVSFIYKNDKHLGDGIRGFPGSPPPKITII